MDRCARSWRVTTQRKLTACDALYAFKHSLRRPHIVSGAALQCSNASDRTRRHATLTCRKIRCYEAKRRQARSGALQMPLRSIDRAIFLVVPFAPIGAVPACSEAAESYVRDGTHATAGSTSDRRCSSKRGAGTIPLRKRSDTAQLRPFVLLCRNRNDAYGVRRALDHTVRTVAMSGIARLALLVVVVGAPS